jgi:heme-degrading monooxygenase HmoA
MAEIYISVTWIVKACEEDAFVETWREFVTLASEQPGSGTFRLARDLENSSHFVSFGSWDSVEAERAWIEAPEFGERLGRVRAHCEVFSGSGYELVTTVG